MQIENTSRYNLATIIVEENGLIHWGMRDRLLYQDLNGIVTHTVIEGETLWSIAAKHYGTAGPELWWVLADFQPEPINDPTIALVAGQTLLIPPLSAVRTALAGDAGTSFMETGL